jgi:hypothetical protein
MNSKHILPLVLIVLNLASSLVYLWHKDYRMAVYWVSAAVLTITVTME